MSDVPEEGSTHKREHQATVRGSGETAEETPLTSITCRILQRLSGQSFNPLLLLLLLSCFSPVRLCATP